MLTVGKHKAHLYHGDQHPASLYLGDRLITGYKILKATGTGRVEIGEQPYKAALPSVVVHGAGKQDKLEGKNLCHNERIMEATQDFGRILDIPYSILKDGETVTISFDTPNTGLNINTDPACGFPVMFVPSNGKRQHFTHKIGTVDRSAPDGYVNVLRSTDAGTVGISSGLISNVQLELSSTPTPYEPYCGGIPAPNPQYPIEPVFLEGASVVGRGRNLLDFLKLHDEGNKAGYSMDAKNGRVFVDSVRPYVPIRFNVSVPANSEITLSIDYIYSRDNIVQISNYGLGGTKVNKTRFTAGSTTLNTYEHSMLVVSCYTSEQTSFDARGIRVTIGSTPTPYTPYYDGGTAPLPILRALPDGSVKDEIDVVSGTVTRRIWEEVFDGSQDEGWVWFKYNGRNGWFISLQKASLEEYNSRYVFSNQGLGGRGASSPNNSVYISRGHVLNFISSGTGDDLQAFRDKLQVNPMKVWYALKEPIIEHYDPAILRQHPGYTQLIQQGGELQAPIDVEYYKEVK